MVLNILETIEGSVDRAKMPADNSSIQNYITRRNEPLTFELALSELSFYIQQYNWGNVPSRLNCVMEAGGVYNIAHRESATEQDKQTQQNQNHLIQPLITNGLRIDPQLVESNTLSREFVSPAPIPLQSAPPLMHVQQQIYQPPTQVTRASQQIQLVSQPLQQAGIQIYQSPQKLTQNPSLQFSQQPI